MSDTFITIIAVISVALVMFIFPLMATANQNDDITQTSVQTIVSEFVNTVAKEGKITYSNYDAFIQKLYATGNSYSVELEAQRLDDNPAQKGENIKVIGENIYYSVFTNTIEDSIDNEGEYLLNQGDYIIAKVKNTNVTFGTQFKNFLYSIVGKDTIAIEASASALVTTTGNIAKKVEVTEPEPIPTPAPEPIIPTPDPEPDKTLCREASTCSTTWCVAYSDDEPSYTCEHDWIECDACGGSGWGPCDGNIATEYTTITAPNGTVHTYYYDVCQRCGWSDMTSNPIFGDPGNDTDHSWSCEACGGNGGEDVCPSCGTDCECGGTCGNCVLDEDDDSSYSEEPCEHGITGGHYTCSHYENTDVTYHNIPCSHGYTTSHYY